MGRNGTLLIDSEARVYDSVGFFERIKKHGAMYPLVISGMMTRPDGIRRMRPVIVETEYDNTHGKLYVCRQSALYKAVQRCIRGMDSYAVRFNQDHVEIEAARPDGTYQFFINRMSRFGRAEIEERIARGEHFIPDGSTLAVIKAKNLG